MRLRPALRRRRTWLVAVPLLAVLVAVVGPFVYINFIQDDPPERLAFADGTTTTTGSSSVTDATETTDTEMSGVWTVADGSEAGYRVDEVLFGQDAEAVGRTSDVTGELEIDGTTITAASFTVDMTTVESDENRRDNQFHNRIIDTATYPTATFELTEPVTLDALPADGEVISVTVTGQFTIRGVTNSVTFELSARRSGAAIEVNGTIPIDFADYGIPDADFGPATVDDHGEIEFLLALSR